MQVDDVWYQLSRQSPHEPAIITIPLDSADTAVERFVGDVAVPLGDRDALFVVRVDPAGAGEPVLGTPDASFTNPLLVDVDGDEAYTP